jgi:hypothetical protein
METRTPEPYLEPVSEGLCEVLNCASPASYRASWAQGVIIKILCNSHKAEIEGKPFGELDYRRKRRD